MSREFNMDTQRQNMWKESIEKEAYVRLAWQSKYGKEIQLDVGTNPRKQTHVPKLIPVIPDLGKSTKKEEPVVKPAETPEKNVVILDEMKPVTPDVREKLYVGFSKEGTGRYKYLNLRKVKDPEAKYEYPITSTMEIGWKIDEHAEMKKPHNGRSRIVRDSFYRNNGIFYQG